MYNRGSTSYTNIKDDNKRKFQIDATNIIAIASGKAFIFNASFIYKHETIIHKLKIIGVKAK